MNDNLITWNIHNWITVFLMFLAGWAVIAFSMRGLKGAVMSRQTATVNTGTNQVA